MENIRKSTNLNFLIISNFKKILKINQNSSDFLIDLINKKKTRENY